MSKGTKNVHQPVCVCVCFLQNFRVQAVLQAPHESWRFWFHEAARRKERKTEREKKHRSICFHPQPSRGQLRPVSLREIASCCSTQTHTQKSKEYGIFCSATKDDPTTSHSLISFIIKTHCIPNLYTRHVHAAKQRLYCIQKNNKKFKKRGFNISSNIKKALQSGNLHTWAVRAIQLEGRLRLLKAKNNNQYSNYSSFSLKQKWLLVNYRQRGRSCWYSVSSVLLRRKTWKKRT